MAERTPGERLLAMEDLVAGMEKAVEGLKWVSRGASEVGAESLSARSAFMASDLNKTKRKLEQIAASCRGRGGTK